MTKVEFTLPDELAKRASDAGLLSSERLQAWLQLQLKGESLTRLRGLMQRADDGETGMSPEDVAKEFAKRLRTQGEVVRAYKSARQG